MRLSLAFAGAISLALISAITATDLDRCMRSASFDVCHHTLSR